MTRGTDSRAVGRRALGKLRPYLVGQPAADGEWEMACPVHEDADPSASLNLNQGVWYCATCGAGGPIGQLIDMADQWVPPTHNGNGASRGHTAPEGVPTAGKVAGWCAALLDNTEGALDAFCSRRGLTLDTIGQRQLGYDMARQCYTIPIHDRGGRLINVRRYWPDRQGHRKMRSLAGHGATRWYPVDQFVSDEIVLCEGELDALILIQHGFAAVTRTNGSKKWMDTWAELFSGKTVYICQDCDTAGQAATVKLAKALSRVTSVYVVRLPYAITDKDGKDVTDYFLDGRTAPDFQRLLDTASEWDADDAQPPLVVRDIESVRLADAFDAANAARPLRFSGAVAGRAGKSYMVPVHVSVQCEPDDTGDYCNGCPFSETRGRGALEIDRNDPILLRMVDVSEEEKTRMMRALLGLPKRCHSQEVVYDKHINATGLMVRPSADTQQTDQRAADLKSERVLYLGPPAELQPGETLSFEGALHPSPKDQGAEFLAWGAYREETSLDRFERTRETESMLRVMQLGDLTPYEKVMEVAQDLEAVTHVYGRDLMHMAMLLVFYSGVSFWFQGDFVKRGWVEGLIVGDSRTGKSKAAARLLEHCQSGVMVPGESASYAGLFGGDKVVHGRQWDFAYGVFPLNDRRCVVLDEVSGMPVEEIGRMSAARSEGRVQVSKIESGDALARTRALWLGNPRRGDMTSVFRPIEVLPGLIGQPEDIARFTFAMGVMHMGEDHANRRHVTREPYYSEDVMRTLRKWAWSRQAHHVVFTPAAGRATLSAARSLGSRYVPDPPLVQLSDVREKVLRLAVAFAQLTYSTRDGEAVLVGTPHISSAVQFLDAIYHDPALAYAQHSAQVLAERQRASKAGKEINEFLRTTTELADYLCRQSGYPFNARDITLGVNVDEATARAWLAKLSGWRLVDNVRNGVRLTPQLIKLLQEYSDAHVRDVN